METNKTGLCLSLETFGSPHFYPLLYQYADTNPPPPIYIQPQSHKRNQNRPQATDKGEINWFRLFAVAVQVCRCVREGRTIIIRLYSCGRFVRF